MVTERTTQVLWRWLAGQRGFSSSKERKGETSSCSRAHRYVWQLHTQPSYQPAHALSNAPECFRSSSRVSLQVVKMLNPEQDVQDIYLKNAKHILKQNDPKTRFSLPWTPWCKSSGALCLCSSDWRSAMWIEKCWTDFLSEAAASLIVSEPCQFLADGKEGTEFLTF